MARQPLSAEKKRVKISISVAPETARRLADAAQTKSQSVGKIIDELTKPNVRKR